MIAVLQIALNNKTKQVDKKACSSHWPQFNFLNGVCIKIQSACASWRAEIAKGTDSSAFCSCGAREYINFLVGLQQVQRERVYIVSLSQSHTHTARSRACRRAKPREIKKRLANDVLLAARGGGCRCYIFNLAVFIN